MLFLVDLFAEISSCFRTHRFILFIRFFQAGMTHRPEKLPALGSDMDLMNISLGQELATKRRFSEGAVTKTFQPPVTFVDGAEYAHVVCDLV